MFPACQFKINKETKELEIDNYQKFPEACRQRQPEPDLSRWTHPSHETIKTKVGRTFFIRGRTFVAGVGD
jgi:hypothetical protein